MQKFKGEQCLISKNRDGVYLILKGLFKCQVEQRLYNFGSNRREIG